MSLFINNTQDRSELQKRIAAELAEKAKKKNADIDLEPKDVDGVDDSEYIKDYKQSRVMNLSKTWLLLIVVLVVTIAAIIILAVRS
ncbi:MAG: hypothetical protein LBK50_00290 [Candidatus Nomurabacteria bacterium]|jgi:hypothetical protein|nr:hypothetical protein [Candidatus Nomurabacteria bacterium]